MNKQIVNLTQLQKDYAVYLPAISGFYNNYISKQRQEEYVPINRIPAGFDRGIEGMNFLNADEGYFTYKYGLYSAGHAQLNLQKTVTEESMIQSRDRNNTLIVGDSGGYQIGKGILKFDWHNFEGKNANKTREDILYWLELTADWSMFLDVPSWACLPANREKTGLTSFQDCLDKTCFNNEYWLNRRLGQTKFLNVLQGSDWESADIWYKQVKQYSDNKIWKDKAAEGWAFGAVNMCQMDIALKRIMTLRDEGLLESKDWIHFLGTAQLDWACFLTSIQRQIRQHVNKNLTISFDCASPFVATAHGLVYSSNQHEKRRFSIIMDKCFDNKKLAGSDIPFPFESAIGSRLTVGDICHYAPGMLNKIGKEGKTSWDSFSYALIMAHNVHNHITAVQKANQLMDIERARFSPDWRSYRKLNSKNIALDEPSEWVPRNILYFDCFVEELFKTKTKKQAFNLIDEAKHFLPNLDGSRSIFGLARNNFNSLFDVEEVNSANDVDTTDTADEEYLKLENEFKKTVD
jgi:hypothetical protein